MPQLARAEELCPKALAAVIVRKESEPVRRDRPRYNERVAARSATLGGLYLEAALLPANKDQAPVFIDNAKGYLDEAVKLPEAHNAYIGASLLTIYMDSFLGRIYNVTPQSGYAKKLKPEITELYNRSRPVSPATAMRLAVHSLYAQAGIVAYPTTGRESGRLWGNTLHGSDHTLYTLDSVQEAVVKVPHQTTRPDPQSNHPAPDRGVFAPNFSALLGAAIKEAGGPFTSKEDAAKAMLRWMSRGRPNLARRQAIDIAAKALQQQKAHFRDQLTKGSNR